MIKINYNMVPQVLIRAKLPVTKLWHVLLVLVNRTPSEDKSTATQNAQNRRVGLFYRIREASRLASDTREVWCACFYSYC